MITWHARTYNLRKYRPTTAYCIKLGKSGTRRSPDEEVRRVLRRSTEHGVRHAAL